MRTDGRSRPSLPLAVVTVLVAGLVACTPETAATTTTTAAPTTTTIGVDIISSEPAAVTVGDGVDAAIAERIELELDRLRINTETIRGLGFLDPPRVAIVGAAEFEERRTAIADRMVDPGRLAVRTRLLQTLRLLEPGQGLQEMVLAVAAEPVPVVYDSGEEELVVLASADPWGSHERSVVVRELVRALVDEYHRYGDRVGELAAEGRHDEADALAGLAAADATYFQLVYLQELPEPERAEAAAARPVTTVVLPEVVNAELAFPYEAGIPFIEALIDDGGLAGLDAAYGTDVLTTEHLRRPVRFLAGEGVREVEPVSATPAGYRQADAGSWGQAALTALLTEAVSPGILTQTADGWGGDSFALYESGADVAFVYTFRGDTVDDAVEVAQGFLDHAAFVMAMNDPVTAGGGLEYVGLQGGPEDEGPYVFVDREGEGLLVVVADELSTGRLLRDTVPVP